MNIVITVRHTSLSDQLRHYIEAKVTKLVRFFDGLHDARVIVDDDGAERHVELVVSGAKGVSFSARGNARDLREAVLQAEHKVEAQVRRHKAKLHPRRPRHPLSMGA